MFKRKYKITYSAITEKGSRERNEDYFGADMSEDVTACVLCDGLGGHGNGDVASKLVVEKMLDAMCDKKMNIEDAVMYSQQKLLEKQEIENAKESMKTTMTGLLIKDGIAKFVHVGDSRIYLFENARYKSRTKDHSISQMLVERGDIAESEIRHHEDRSRLLRAMGTEWNTPKYEVSRDIKISRKTSFLMCSDGFWELIDEKEMCRTLKEADTPKEWLEAMENIVLEAGKGTDMDNYSALAVFVRGS